MQLTDDTLGDGRGDGRKGCGYPSGFGEETSLCREINEGNWMVDVLVGRKKKRKRSKKNTVYIIYSYLYAKA